MLFIDFCVVFFFHSLFSLRVEILSHFCLEGMAQFVSNFAEPDDPEYAPPVQKGETPVR